MRAALGDPGCPGIGPVALILTLLLALAAGCDRREAASPDSGADAGDRAWQADAGHRADGGAPEPAGPQPGLQPADASAPGGGPPGDHRPPPPPARPEAWQAGEDIPAFLPLADASAGEWAEYKTLSGRHLRYEITGAGSETVSTRVTVEAEGQVLGLPAMREDRRDADPLAGPCAHRPCVRRAGPARVEAAGRQWEAILYEERWTDEDVDYVRRTWVSPAAPVFGLLRMELDGDGQREAELLLAACGTASQP